MDWSGVIGNIGGAVIGGLFGKSSAQDQFERQKDLMELQHKYQVEDFRHRYQWSTEDMKAAGLNPILAATSGIGGNISGVSAGNAAMAPTPDFAGAINSGLARDLVKSEMKIKQQEADTNRMNALTAARNVDNEVAFRTGTLQLKQEYQAFQMKLEQEMNDAKIRNMVDTLEATKAHYERQDMNGAAAASAAMAQAAASQEMARIAEENGISLRALQDAEAVLKSEQAGTEAQRHLTEEQKTLRAMWENSPEYRTSQSAVGMVASVLSLASMAQGVRYQLDID